MNTWSINKTEQNHLNVKIILMVHGEYCHVVPCPTEERLLNSFKHWRGASVSKGCSHTYREISIENWEASWSLVTPRSFVGRNKERKLWRAMRLGKCIGEASPSHTHSFRAFADATGTGCIAARRHPGSGSSVPRALQVKLSSSCGSEPQRGILCVCPRPTLGYSWAHSNLRYSVFKMVLRSAGPTLPWFSRSPPLSFRLWPSKIHILMT